jgi:sugar phosphate isomerase/epimerase
MRLCFDATRFGSGLQEAVQFAAEQNLSAFDFSFGKFEVSKKAARKLDKTELDYLKGVHEQCQKQGISISCLRLNALLKISEKKSVSEFSSMCDKLVKVSAELACKQILFYMEAEADPDWLEQAEKILTNLVGAAKENNVSLVLSLSTPETFRGRSLKFWRPLELDELRHLLAGVPDLSLSFSVADCAWQGIDYLKILPGLVPAIAHVEAQDVQVNRQIISENGIFGPLWWRYMTVGKGQVDWGQFVEALKLYDYQGDLSISFNDEFASENEQGLWEALEMSKKLLLPLVKY